MTKDVREQIADGIGLIYCSQCKIPTDVDACPTCDKIHEIAHRQADQILALTKPDGTKAIGVIADEQGMPQTYSKYDEPTFPDIVEKGAQQDMLNANFKRVV